LTGGGTTGIGSALFQLNTGIGGSGGARGSIIGFGSILVNNLRLDIDDAEFEIEGETFRGSEGQARLTKGQQILAPYDASSLNNGAYNAIAVVYGADLKGPITAVPTPIDPATGSGTLTVMGQTVFTNATTRFSDITDITALASGMLLEISGARDANGNLIATFVEGKTSLDEYKAVGRVSAISGSTFQLNGLSVDFSATSYTPTAGDDVEVKFGSSDFTAPASARARTISSAPTATVSEGAEVSIEGVVDQFTSASDFSVNGLRITTTAATTYENGTADAIALGSRVEAEGRVNASGVLVAEEIELKLTQAVRVEGTIAANGIDLAARTLRMDVGLTIVVQSVTDIEDKTTDQDNLTLESLAPGDYLRLRGYRSGSDYVAAEIERDEADQDQRLRAPIATVNAANGRLTFVDGPTVTATALNTTFEGGVTLATFFGALVPGTFVEAVWNPWDPAIGTTDTVDRMTVEGDDDEDDD
jgi:hypothetical protein